MGSGSDSDSDVPEEPTADPSVAAAMGSGSDSDAPEEPTADPSLAAAMGSSSDSDSDVPEELTADPSLAAAMGSGSDSDAPEELTAEQGVIQDEEIRRVQRENKTRLAQEAKERRRHWAQRKSGAESDNQKITEVKETEQQDKEQDVPEQQEEQDIPGMLPSNIVNLLAAQERKTFSSDSEEEVIDQKLTTKKKKQKIIGRETVLLKDIPHAQCLQNSVDFLKRRKMKVPRSQSTLKNANKALRLISSRGGL